ncbi:M1 family peptidase [Thalassotalea euphylliae]|uniref:M1 family peptidase n=2 Tax=Thalassotalea euphylliae TaxID=1655234 RepID=A0A3E0U6U0_9GAMM|nr:M1 family peptidase [Thalassotalea euphylliae]
MPNKWLSAAVSALLVLTSHQVSAQQPSEAKGEIKSETKNDINKAKLNTPDISEQRQQHLRGAITAERAWWDVKHYQLSMTVDIGDRSFSGENIITYQVIDNAKELQIELQAPMKLEAAVQAGQSLAIRQEGYSYFISPNELQQIGQEYQLTLTFSGQPHEAKNAPWDGGITWSEDEGGMPFIASSNQGIGASIWWPNKDHGYDEPDRGIDMLIEVPRPLFNVSNGRLINIEDQGDSRVFHWRVINPINNYGVNINIADYVNFAEQYQGENGVLDMDYYVLRANEEKARVHFGDARRTIEALEHWFGPYPFYQDSYKLVEAPYLGMEHQSSVTYGNKYQQGYKGRDLSETGWGLKWDFLIIHETAHEWFANSITAKDVADLWIQESFTTYAEGLFVEYHYGKAAGAEYLRGQRQNIRNDKPMIGTYHQHEVGSYDIYPKGANMLHTLRQLIDDDSKWREILRGLNKVFYHQTVTTQQVEDYIATQSGLVLNKFFDQYLRDSRIPVLEYRLMDGEFKARWRHVVDGFAMAIPAKFTGGVASDQQNFALTTDWQTFELSQGATGIQWDKNYYIAQLLIE